MNKIKFKGFTLAEMLVATLVLSIMLVVMAPVMTKKAKERVSQKIEVVQSQEQGVPVGAIVLWYGPDIPEGWQECSGQMLDENEMSELKNAISTSDYLPDLNRFLSTADSNLKYIIKVKN
ncbi:TPA: tail fiber protein [Candidatus Galligastranaerophilus faecipullorum]|nr:tail fiber protein [Candidatus Galligastranaerophilus faecipullorum]